MVSQDRPISGAQVGAKQEAFQRALRRGHSFAWDRQWAQAVAAYQAALAIVPDDPAALTGLGMALVQLGRLPDALTVYQRLARQNPSNAVALEKVAEIQEKLGQAGEAARTLLLLAEAHLRQHTIQGELAAMAAWERAAHLAPDLIGPHQGLARVYERQGKTRQAIQEYLTLARLFSQRQEMDKATAACQAALQLDPHDAEVLRALDLVRQGHSLDNAALTTMSFHTVSLAGSSQDNPALDAREKAIAALAERAATLPASDEPPSLRGILNDEGRGATDDSQPLASSGSMARRPASIGALLTRGLDAQKAGNSSAAVQAFEEARAAGEDSAAFHFNLGLLYQEQLRFDEALRELRRSVEDPEYALGSHFAMGECYRATGQIEEAVRHFIEALKIVDVSATVEGEAESVIELYASLADTYTARGQREQAIAFTNALVSFLSGPDWQMRAAQARQRLNEASAEAGMTVSLGEMLDLQATGGRVLKAMADCRRAMEQGHIMTAIEECYRAIELAPFYLPAHERLAELLAQEGRLEEAAAKYGIIAQTYRERGDVNRAIAACMAQLRLSPLELGTQETLIALLLQRGQLDRALEQTLALADAYYQLAQVDKAAETYREALKLASRLGSRHAAVQILHRLGDIDTQRLDWQSAAIVYKQIRRLAPQDERAMEALVELYFKLGQSQRALAELDALLHLYKQRGDIAKVRSVLQELVNTYPEEVGLRERFKAVGGR